MSREQKLGKNGRVGAGRKRQVLLFSAVILLLPIITVSCFIMDKLGRISYSDGTVELWVQEDGEIADTEEAIIDEAELSILKEAEVSYSDMEIFADSDVFNILLLGTDERTDEFSEDARADSIILLSLNRESKAMKLVSLERGMGVPVLEGPYQGQYDWLTHCFRYGGASLMLKEIRECLRVEVDRYVRVNENAFVKLIDSIGGVDIELTELEAKGLNGEIYTNAITKATVYEGKNHLDGNDAMAYVRIRYIDSDWRRIERQRNLIQSVVYAAKNMNPVQLNDAANAVLPMIQTNLTKTEILELVAFAPNVLGMKFEQMSIPIQGSYGSMEGMGGRNLYAVDFETNAEALRAFLYNGGAD